MKLIVGLGNFDKKYDNTPHNIGFMVLNEMAEKYKLKFFKKDKFKGEIAEKEINREKIIFLKPITYMNLSGISVFLVKKYYKIKTENILIIYDDNDLLFGNVRFKKKGSSAGHKGIDNIIKNLNTNNISRARLGIKKNNTLNLEKYVLSSFKKKEIEILQKSIKIIIKGVEIFINSNIDNAMNLINRKNI